MPEREKNLRREKITLDLPDYVGYVLEMQSRSLGMTADEYIMCLIMTDRSYCDDMEAAMGDEKEMLINS